ncbi:MAG: endonuclease domain-containing protein [Thiolinea sp.]
MFSFTGKNPLAVSSLTSNVQFYRQKPISGFIVDFYCAAAQLVIELDGKHHLEQQQYTYDAERTRILESLGLQVLRFNNHQITDDLESSVWLIHQVVLRRL